MSEQPTVDLSNFIKEEADCYVVKYEQLVDFFMVTQDWSFEDSREWVDYNLLTQLNKEIKYV